MELSGSLKTKKAHSLGTSLGQAPLRLRGGQMLGQQYSRAPVLCPVHPLLVLPPSSGTPDCYEGALVLIIKSAGAASVLLQPRGGSVSSSSSQPPSEVCTRNCFIVRKLGKGYE